MDFSTSGSVAGGVGAADKIELRFQLKAASSKDNVFTWGKARQNRDGSVTVRGRLNLHNLVSLTLTVRGAEGTVRQYQEDVSIRLVSITPLSRHKYDQLRSSSVKRSVLETDEVSNNADNADLDITVQIDPALSLEGPHTYRFQIDPDISQDATHRYRYDSKVHPIFNVTDGTEIVTRGIPKKVRNSDTWKALVTADKGSGGYYSVSVEWIWSDD